MRRRLTIVVAEDVYLGLREHAGPAGVSRYIEDLVRPHVVEDTALEEAYREAARDEAAERDAREWLDAQIDADID